jgi:hypothetical protein
MSAVTQPSKRKTGPRILAQHLPCQTLAGLAILSPSFSLPLPSRAFLCSDALLNIVRQPNWKTAGGDLGIWAFMHVDETERATVAALEHGGPIVKPA